MSIATSRRSVASIVPAVLFALLVLFAAPQASAQTLDAGGRHTCAIVTGGEVKCWGMNRNGQIGTATNAGTDNANPTPITAIASGATAVEAGNSTTCAIVAGGEVKCWGSNRYGQIGPNRPIGEVNPAPVTVIASGASKISVGGRHACAVLTGGEVKCWGGNLSGQLGTTVNAGTLNATPTPVTVIASGATAIAAGGNHTCAIVTGGAVRCWGFNGSGQIGTAVNAGTENANPTPVTVITSGAVRISAGGNHTCAVVGIGGLPHRSCWGANFSGQLASDEGIGSHTPHPTPVTEPMQSNKISTGEGHTCAIMFSTSVPAVCWGDNYFGQLASSTNNRSTAPNPNFNFGVSGATDIAAGGEHTCAVVVGGQVKCWGNNRYGQIGSATNTGTDEPNPVAVTVITSGSVAVEDALLRGQALHLDVRGTSVRFSVAVSQPVRAELFNALGQQLAALFDGEAGAGQTHTLAVPAGLSAGVYLVRVSGRAFAETALVVVPR